MRKIRIRFRKVKDLLILPIHGALKATERSPRMQRAVMGAVGVGAKAYYFSPTSHVRRTTANFCRLLGRPEPRATYFRLVDNAMQAGTFFGALMREGPASVAQHVTFDPASLALCERVHAEHGCGIFVVPHCAGSVLSACAFARRFPSLALVRESKSRRRGEIMRQYFDRLGAEMLFVRRAEPASLARAILRALHEKKFIIGTTDLLRRKDDTVEVRVFGQSAWMPDWPARFAARRKVPIIPGFCHMEEGRIVLIAGEPYMEQDITRSTQRWADFFAARFREYPSDWLFMYEKRWAKLIANAAESA